VQASCERCTQVCKKGEDVRVMELFVALCPDSRKLKEGTDQMVVVAVNNTPRLDVCESDVILRWSKGIGSGFSRLEPCI
jgi:hypothetical protein